MRPEMEAKVLFNRSRPIRRLPNKVLAMAFEFAMVNESYSRPARERRPPFNVTLVSTMWRDVVMSSRTLWAHIDTSNLPLVEMFVSRPRQAVLNIELSGSSWVRLHPRSPSVGEQANTTDIDEDNEFSRCIEVLLQVGRWRSLETSDIPIADWYPCLLSPAPMLECLEMQDVYDM
ncbi:hypothetical protein BOTBODRAFT_186159 [Botryobasidium botryosum FD-172 SS1]|uniref:F-box domain-containing protein n=1 Tax=Botryobasidium botryosum (strain FD-172 SS1) TaxID=930990 RepID=A0A067MN52_BOTB1|nr:hypothetical protein BOTBODRAFT_186159 [Botryobasidium botryosum FD-172 SS1]